jgi:hypothetical protein
VGANQSADVDFRREKLENTPERTQLETEGRQGPKTVLLHRNHATNKQQGQRTKSALAPRLPFQSVT